MMKRVIFAGLALMVSMTAMAQDDGSKIILPLEAQQCNLPSAPPPIPEAPVKDDLLKAQKFVRQFQGDMEIYRACLDKDSENPALTWGNQQALNNAHDYSVDMEERVAAMFNEALQVYKAGLAKD
jgi:hypothetical protein